MTTTAMQRRVGSRAAAVAAMLKVATALTVCGGTSGNGDDIGLFGSNDIRFAVIPFDGKTLTATRSEFNQEHDAEDNPVGKPRDDQTSVTWVEQSGGSIDYLTNDDEMSTVSLPGDTPVVGENSCVKPGSAQGEVFDQNIESVCAG
ncbi:hypothetical protein GCM10025781_26410 [Kocuria gwangalliensis]|uniref:Uncharacterized protein n=1 Tax=Kocuria gwangalliensis TaxID=501592 RepID=A0ABP8XE97_9MICC